MTNSTITIYVGNIIHCSQPFIVNTYEKGFIAIQGTKIIAINDLPNLDNFKAQLGNFKLNEVILKDSQLLIPGFIDTHLHASQYPNLGLGLNMPLLEWLNHYTFPMEQNFRDFDFSQKVYNSIVRQTLRHGTTTACYFATLFADTTLLLVDAAIKYGQRAFVGKVNMTRCAPLDYLETPEECFLNTDRFVRDVLEKDSDLVKPVITPRFAISLEMDDLKQLANLAKDYDLLIQTHVCENKSEIKEVKKLFNKSYLEVYEEAGILTEKTILAHAVHLDKWEMKLLAEKGVSVSHCPSSNINLRSGLCQAKELIHSGVNVGLGTDVSGGTSVSIIDSMRAAINTSISISFNKFDYQPLNCYDVFYLATLGGAKALSIADVTGNFEVGKDFDALIIDLNVEDGCFDYFHNCGPLELLQKFIQVGDDRNVASVFVAGRRVK